MSIGERIKERRKALGITQAQLALKVESDSNTVSRWERSSIIPGTDYIKKLASALRTTESYLISGEGGDRSRDVIKTTVRRKVDLGRSDAFAPDEIEEELDSALYQPAPLNEEEKAAAAWALRTGKRGLIVKRRVGNVETEVEIPLWLDGTVIPAMDSLMNRLIFTKDGGNDVQGVQRSDDRDERIEEMNAIMRGLDTESRDDLLEYARRFAAVHGAVHVEN
jgi:transcriptional regulator with XRE-family HTH domain